jgi:hypothetical protein
MATPTPIPTPLGAGLGPEIMPLPTSATAVAPKKVETVAGMPVGPEIVAEAIPMGAPPENPTAILGIIEEAQETGKQAREICEDIAAADIKQTEIAPEASSETPTTETQKIKNDTTDTTLTPTDEAVGTTQANETPSAESTPAADTESSIEAKKREEIKRELRELGKILLDIQDIRASIVALGLSAGNTPIADEFV